MDFIQGNIGNILVGGIVFAALAWVVIRVVINFRRGKTGCGCGCSGCEKRKTT